MPRSLLHYFTRLVESYLFVVIAAIVLGLVFSASFALIAPYTTLMLQVIFFLSSLKLEVAELLQAGKQWRTLLTIDTVVLVILPIIVFWVASIVTPTMAFALMLLAAMPAAMSLPLMVDVIAGDRSLALLLTISSSLMAPITVPFVLSTLTSTDIQLPFLNMAWRLFFVIIIPFIVAQIIRHGLRINISAVSFTFKPISLILLGLLIAASLAVNAEAIQGVTEGLTQSLVVLFLFFIGVHLFTHLIFHRKKYREQVTIAASVTFMNFTLAIYLASLYVPEPRVLLMLVLSIIPWATLLIPFKYVTDYMKTRGWVS